MFDFITRLIEAAGAPGVGLLMLLENLFPPIPSELIMPLAGYSASLGRIGLVAAVLWGTAGSLLGALFWYAVGRAIGAGRLQRLAARHGRWMTVRPEDITRATLWFGRHGGKAVFLGRLVPTLRTLISIPAGVARMPLLPFLAWSALGSLLWVLLLTGAGWMLGAAYERVETWVNPVSTAIVVGIVALWLWRVLTWNRPRRDKTRTDDRRGGG